MKYIEESNNIGDVYEEGILSRAGARVAGAKAGVGTYFGNIGKTLTGKAAPTSPAEAAKNAKLQSAYKSAAKGLLDDLQKLGLLPKQNVPPQVSNQVAGTLVNLVSQMQGAQATRPSTPAPATSTTAIARPAAPAPSAPKPAAAPAPAPVAASAPTATKASIPLNTVIDNNTFNGTKWVNDNGAPVSAKTSKDLTTRALNGEGQVINPKPAPASPVSTTSKRSRKRNAKRVKSQSDETFAFSSALPFKKFFPVNKPTIR